MQPAEAQIKVEQAIIMGSVMVEARNGTLAARWSGEAKLIDWLDAKHAGWPPEGHAVWAFLLEHCTLGSVLTPASSVVVFLRFCFHQLGISALQYIDSSKRLTEYAVRNILRMGPRKGAVLLEKNEMLVLQTTAESEELNNDEHLAFTAAISQWTNRNRHTDMNFILSMQAELALVVSQSTQAKTSGCRVDREEIASLAPRFLLTHTP